MTRRELAAALQRISRELQTVQRIGQELQTLAEALTAAPASPAPRATTPRPRAPQPAARRGGPRSTPVKSRQTWRPRPAPTTTSATPAEVTFPDPCAHCRAYCGPYCECSCHRAAASAVRA